MVIQDFEIQDDILVSESNSSSEDELENIKPKMTISLEFSASRGLSRGVARGNLHFLPSPANL
jgi:hypothetical protein